MWRPEVIIFPFLVPIINSSTTSLRGVTTVHVKQVFPIRRCGVVLKLVYCCKMIGPFLCVYSDVCRPAKGWNSMTGSELVMGVQAVLYERTLERIDWE